jgi:hypothetical protein
MLVRTKREQGLLVITLLVIVGGLGYVGYTKYLEKSDELQERSMALDQQYVTMMRTLRNLRAIEARYERITSDLRLPGDESLWPIRIRDEIDRFLEKAGIETKGRTEPEQPIYHDDVEAVEFRFRLNDLEAPLPVLARFLSLLEEESAVLEVKQLEIRPIDRRRGGKHGVRVTMRISRIVFTRPEVT